MRPFGLAGALCARFRFGVSSNLGSIRFDLLGLALSKDPSTGDRIV